MNWRSQQDGVSYMLLTTAAFTTAGLVGSLSVCLVLHNTYIANLFVTWWFSSWPVASLESLHNNVCKRICKAFECTDTYIANLFVTWWFSSGPVASLESLHNNVCKRICKAFECTPCFRLVILSFDLSTTSNSIAHISCLRTSLIDSIWTCLFVAPMQSLLLALLDVRLENREDSLSWESETYLLWKVWWIPSKLITFLL